MEICCTKENVFRTKDGMECENCFKYRDESLKKIVVNSSNYHLARILKNPVKEKQD